MEQESRPRTPKVKLEEILLRHGSITQEQLQQAVAEQKKWGGDLGRVMVDLGFITEELLISALAHSLGIARINPDEVDIPRDIVGALGVQVCERFGVIAVGGDPKKVLKVATSDPTNLEELRALGATTKLKIEPVAATTDRIHRAIRKHYYGETAAEMGEVRSLDGAGMTGMSAPMATPTPGLPATGGARGTGESASNGLSADLVVQLIQRISQVEQTMKLVTNPQFAALTARLERLEQLAASEASAIRAMGELLVEKAVLGKEEFLTRMRGKKP